MFVVRGMVSRVLRKLSAKNSQTDQAVSSTPLVSVIIPTCNREREVVRAIESVQRQTYSNLEIIVVDDCSKDSTFATVKAIDDPRIQALQHSTNLYAGAARNTGMKAASGKYIAFLDSDDTWVPEKIELQVQLLEQNKEAGFCFAGVTMQKGRGYREKDLLPNLPAKISKEDLLTAYMLGKVIFITSTMMFRRNLLDEVGLMDESLRRNQDIDFFIRFIESSNPASIEQPLTNFFPNGKPPKLNVIEESNRRLLSKHADRFRKLGAFRSSQIIAFYRFAHGKRHIKRGQFLTGLRWLGHGIATNPVLPVRQYLGIVHKIGMRMFSELKGSVSSGKP